MMSKKSPQLRFEGFTDDWEEHKLGDYIIQYSEKTKQNNQYPVFTSSRNGLFFQKDYYKGNQIASEDNIGYNIVPRGYFTYRHMSDDLVFKFNINDLADYGIVSTLYPVFTTNEQLNSKYLQYQLNEGSEFRRFSLFQKQGGSRTYMYLNKLQNIILNIPKLEEQQKIGSFFKQLDDTIALHQRKLDLLKEQKKGYLQKMFPKNGEKVPELRFAGFADDWELRKFGEVVYRSNLISSSKDLPRLEFEDINSGLGTLNKDISQKLDDRKGLEFNVGDVLFGKLRPYLKNWWYAEFKGIALGDFWNLKSDLWHSCFLYTYIQSNSFQLVANGTSGTKMPRSDWNLVAESIAKFPTLAEQEAIGSFFSTLDQHITLHQRKLDLLKEQKKGFLQKMFV